jgi:hypothetical protein
VTGWRAAGVIRTHPSGNTITNSVLSIWRETNPGSDTYVRVNRIELGICDGQDLTSGTSNIYECTLPQAVSVQPGYIVGIELPPESRSKFRLYFNSQGGQTNHVFDGHGSTFSLSDAISFEQASDQPQIILTIEPDIVPTTTALPTTQPLPATTEALLTMTDLPTTPSLTSTSMATTEPPTSTEASTTMDAATEPPTSTEDLTTAAATDPSTTTTGSPTTTTAVMISVNSESTAADSITTEIPSSATTDARTPREGEAVQQRESNTGTIAGAAVGAIIAVLLVLTIVLLLVLILRRQTRNGQQFTPSSISNIVNAAYISGKPSYSQFRDCFLFLVFLL